MVIYCLFSAIKGEGRVGAVTVAKADLEKVLESAESARIKLYKNIEVCYLSILITTCG